MKSAATYNSIHVKDMELNITSSYHTATTLLQSISIITAHSCSQTPCAFPAMPCLAVRPSQHDVCLTSTAGQFLAKEIYKCTLVGVAYMTCKPWYLMKTCLAHYNHSCCGCVYTEYQSTSKFQPICSHCGGTEETLVEMNLSTLWRRESKLFEQSTSCRL